LHIGVRVVFLVGVYGVNIALQPRANCIIRNRGPHAWFDDLRSTIAGDLKPGLAAKKDTPKDDN
jgi:hypothetical protein